VFVNGASLDSTDYTATNGTSVVLGSAASLNDEVVIVAFKSFTVADTYTQSQVDAFAVKLTGAQTVSGVKTFSNEPVFSAGIALASGQGINFGASSNASGMTSETLSDYEEGAFTPTIATNGTQPTGISYQYQRGEYTKVGRLVTVQFMVGATWSNSPTGSFFVSLPFTSNHPQSSYAVLNIAYGAGITYPSGKTSISGELPNGNASVSIVGNGSGVGGSALAIVTNVTSGFVIEASITYMTT
jgi:hypothetical protein